MFLAGLRIVCSVRKRPTRQKADMLSQMQWQQQADKAQAWLTGAGPGYEATLDRHAVPWTLHSQH